MGVAAGVGVEFEVEAADAPFIPPPRRLGPARGDCSVSLELSHASSHAVLPSSPSSSRVRILEPEPEPTAAPAPTLPLYARPPPKP